MTPGEPPSPSDPLPDLPPVAPRRHLTFKAAVVLATVVLVAGVVVVVGAWRDTGGPDGAVRGYFAALRDGDAETALAYGTVPAGPRGLLSDDVLALQQRIAPIRDVGITKVSDDGDRARVGVRYTLAFAAGSRHVTATVSVRREDGDWRLDRSAVATQLLVEQASDRALVAGTAVPQGTTLLFPGAVPLTFDTPYLALDPARATVPPDAEATTQVEPTVTDDARDAVIAAVRTSLERCLKGDADPRCPTPDERYVPGSVRGELTGSLAKELTVQITTSDAGEFTITGDVSVRGGYQKLGFDNRVTSKTGADFTVPVAAHAYAVAPIALRWDPPA